MADISIIIPTFNRLWSLPEAIASCKGTNCNVELIVVDDGSSDGTSEWLRTQTGLTVLRQQNLGKCWAVNSAFDMSKGRYIKFLDSDDKLVTDAIDPQFEQAVRENADVIVGGYSVEDDVGVILKSQKWIYCDDFISQQLGECDSSHYSAYLFKKSFISDIPHRPDFSFRDDRLFVLEVALKNPIVSNFSDITLIHRHHKQERLQFHNDIKQIVQNYQHFMIYKRILAELKETDRLTPRRAHAAAKVLWPLAHWVAKTSIREAMDLVKWIKVLNPSFNLEANGITGKMYKLLGFATTEKVLKLRRFFRYGWN